MNSPIARDAERLAGGLDRSTLVVAGVATLGLIMAVLDTEVYAGVRHGDTMADTPAYDEHQG